MNAQPGQEPLTKSLRDYVNELLCCSDTGPHLFAVCLRANAEN